MIITYKVLKNNYKMSMNIISKHPEYESVIKESISDMRYEIQSLFKLLDSEHTSEDERSLF